MKAKKKILYVIISLVTLVIIGLSIKFVLANYNGKESKAAVNNFFEKYQDLDESCGEYLLGNETGAINFSGSQILFAKSLEFDIKNVKQGEKYSIVNVNVENVDFIQALKQVLEENSDDTEGMTENIITLLESKKAPRKKFKIEVWIDNNSNKIQMTGDLANALLGGYHEMINDLLIGGELNEEIN